MHGQDKGYQSLPVSFFLGATIESEPTNQLTLSDIVPVNTLEEWVGLDLFHAVLSQTVLFSCKESIECARKQPCVNRTASHIAYKQPLTSIGPRTL